MLIQKNWLQDYININKTDEEIADILSLSGSSVEEIIKEIDDNVVVVEILEIEPHPNADRLRLATVFDGTSKIRIVCGAKNIDVGQNVSLAKIGAKLPGGLIEQANIRGIDSFGMLCGAEEIGLKSETDGVLVLSKSYTPGTKLNTLEKNETIFDVEVTANRGDCLSHLGIARELSALLNEKLMLENYDAIGTKTDIEISILSENCKSYFIAELTNIVIVQSPDWIIKRLKNAGIKAINNVVDITNFIMLDSGQPLHAFDADKLASKKIVVRQASTNETLVCLDKQERILSEDNLVIADSKKPIAIAGVIGGSNSEIDDKTNHIIIEAALFDERSIRKTSKDFNLSTEASYRFERGIDSSNILLALKKAVKMIMEIQGSKLIGMNSYEKNQQKIIIDLPIDKINSLAGVEFDKKEISSILCNLGFLIENDKVTVPSHRHDVGLWQDLAEEIARIKGYNTIKRQPILVDKRPTRSSYYVKEAIKDILVDNGFNEVFGYAFMSEKDLLASQITANDLVEVSNPVSPENKFLRKSLLPGLFKFVAKNPIFDPVCLFEIGHVFTKDTEKVNLAIVASGKNVKKLIYNLKDKLNLDLQIKELISEDLKNFKIRKAVTYVAEIDIDSIKLPVSNEPLQDSGKKINYKQVSKYPPVVRDLAFIVDENILAQNVVDEINSLGDQILLVELFDEFSSDKFGKNKKNIAFHIYLQDLNRALVDSEADTMIKEIIDRVLNKFNGLLRD